MIYFLKHGLRRNIPHYLLIQKKVNTDGFALIAGPKIKNGRAHSLLRRHLDFIIGHLCLVRSVANPLILWKKRDNMSAFDKAWALVKQNVCEARIDPECTKEADVIIDDLSSWGYACNNCAEHYGGLGVIMPLDAYDDDFGKSEEKGKFRGYSKNTVSGRAERQGKARAWNKSRKVARGRTRRKYSRQKSRGNVRPKMRRQLGAGGSRKETSR